jgi:hypothetical protein
MRDEKPVTFWKEAIFVCLYTPEELRKPRRIFGTTVGNLLDILARYPMNASMQLYE